MICCLPSNSALKVWKNSSCVRSLPAKNWMSSISSASTCWNWRLNCVHRLVLQRLHHRAEELFASAGTARACPGCCARISVAGGEHQVGLAQAGAAVQQQRVVGAVAGLQRDLPGGGAAELVAAAFDEVVEGVVRVEVAVERLAAGALRTGAVRSAATASRRRAQRADFQAAPSPLPAKCAQQLADARQVALAHLSTTKALGAYSTRPSSRWRGLQRLEPGVDIFGRQFGFQAFEAAGPGIHRAMR